MSSLLTSISEHRTSILHLPLNLRLLKKQIHISHTKQLLLITDFKCDIYA